MLFYTLHRGLACLDYQKMTMTSMMKSAIHPPLNLHIDLLDANSEHFASQQLKPIDQSINQLRPQSTISWIFTFTFVLGKDRPEMADI